MSRRPTSASAEGVVGYLRSIQLRREIVESFDKYPFSIPAIRALDELIIDPKVTFLVGENGSGKSTLIEAIAVASGFNAEGGTKNFNFATRRSESDLHRHLRLARARGGSATASSCAPRAISTWPPISNGWTPYEAAPRR